MQHQTQHFSQYRVEDVIRRLQTVDPYASQLLQQEFNMAAAITESSDTTPTTTSSSAPSTSSSTPSTKGLSKRDQVQRALQVLGRALASRHPAGLAGIIAGATATNPSSLRPSYSGAAGGGSDTSKHILPNSLGRSFSSFTFRVLIGLLALVPLPHSWMKRGSARHWA
jgi:hypothetical protein